MNHFKLKFICSLVLLTFTARIAFAQHHDHFPAGSKAPATSYAGQQTRQIKALSTQEQQDWLDGKGLGMAKAAELNGYPGPMHTLEYAEQLNLNADQRQKTQALLLRHKAAVRDLGALLVAEEKNLDRQFAGKTISPAQVSSLTASIAELQGRIRAEHLRTHLDQTALLTDGQIAQYQVLRGYTN